VDGARRADAKIVSDVKGQEAAIPTGGISLYFAQPGDTLWDIAKRYRVPRQQLMGLNPALTDGQVTQGPGGGVGDAYLQLKGVAAQGGQAVLVGFKQTAGKSLAAGVSSSVRPLSRSCLSSSRSSRSTPAMPPMCAAKRPTWWRCAGMKRLKFQWILISL